MLSLMNLFPYLPLPSSADTLNSILSQCRLRVMLSSLVKSVSNMSVKTRVPPASLSGSAIE